MSVSSETIKRDIDLLTSDQLRQIADFIAFLRFRDQRQRAVLDPEQLALLETEFADEDRAIAEEGMDDYAAMLSQEDLL
ncbi:MAG: hypothetical protein WA949_08125 [Phormidesmis sp.]